MPDIWFDVDTEIQECPVNLLPLTDDTDFKARETAVAYNATGMDLVWNFLTCAGAFTQTAVTPATGTPPTDYAWVHQGDGMYSIDIPASGGGSINNDTEGFGWFTGVCTGVLPWRGPVIGFRAAGLNDKMVESAYDTTRGLAGTALPAAAAEASGGLYTRGTGAGQINQDANGRADVNVAAISSDATAADNCELMFDGTGYAGGTARLGVDVVSISGDATAADNLEAACDGNTYNIGGGAVVAASVTGSVGSVASGGITAASIATGAIDADALAADAVDEILDEVVEGTITMRQALRLFLSALTGKASGGGTTTITFRDVGDSKDRIVMTVDASGNRSAVGTRDGS